MATEVHRTRRVPASIIKILAETGCCIAATSKRDTDDGIDVRQLFCADADRVIPAAV